MLVLSILLFRNSKACLLKLTGEKDHPLLQWGKMSKLLQKERTAKLITLIMLNHKRALGEREKTASLLKYLVQTILSRECD
jgi:hypothetical protein